MILKKLNPVLNYQGLRENLEELAKFKKYQSIILELQEEGKLEKIGFSWKPLSWNRFEPRTFALF